MMQSRALSSLGDVGARFDGDRTPRSIPERIAACATTTPDGIAVVDETCRLTYAELEHESTQLAARLRDVRAGPEDAVGLFLRPSAQFVIAALAVLKSGAAYIPLDPSTPLNRLSAILADAGVVAVVTCSDLADGLSEAPWAVIVIDRPAKNGTRRFSPMEIDPDSLAYIIYTSGSTGQPKGVEVTHANLYNLIDWHQSAFAVTAADRASQVAGLGFDAAVWEIWPYLTAGSSLYIADESTRRSPEALRDWLVTEKITIAFIPTVFAEQLFRADWPAETTLRLLLTGGDTLQRRPAAGLPFIVINNYGPTECTVVATSGTVSPEKGDLDRPSIGRPITNATALVLDDALHPVANGEPGELCIGGALVARGYRNLHELTASRFVTYATASGESLRLYRTGDRARLLETGEIEFLGRVDDQVKIRGYRIELGEIETWLSRHPGIAACTVSVISVGAGDPALAAYIIPKADARLTESELREYLGANLPDYMVPAFFVLIGALPVTANGKLDKAALPAPHAENLLLNASATNGELSSVEAQIAGLVASLIGRPAIGADENFFMIGGHSMLGVQLVARIREVFHIKLPLRNLFAAPTVRELSSEVARLIATN